MPVPAVTLEDKITDAVTARIEALIPGTKALRRQVLPTDPHGCVGMTLVSWQPDTNMIGQYAPGSTTYVFAIQLLVKHSNEEDGERLHGQLSRKVRSVVMADQTLREQLAVISDSVSGALERYYNHRAVEQRFASADNNKGGFMFVSVLEIAVQTDIIG